mmetsp:Transcript_18784/g.52329  ORF Transcript_18784/g.52329 Transcript_18784/m.52329 type:complete len:92 (-) Transcript_18784:213-488(-)|eukprot:CAMPEP_0117663744 /NCGR_PEP_ID=MMETSP0804-20121206/8789_1 /TAXON_ID=1074897 /ORGANISM="Tetraselmis astigmatica, Strain CCMP880" /LENGTH=91 /DNA_ID=CAMNT_0005470809 /DNA_START=148 /DNA_END=423 /DNA_ORIENTATION=+
MVWKGFEFGPAPADYKGSKQADPVGYFRQREHEVREEYVKQAQAKILRERLKACYRKEEVNHMKNCKEIAAQYLDTVKAIGVYRANNGQYE